MKNFQRGLLIVSPLVTVLSIIVTLYPVGKGFLRPPPLVESAPAATQPSRSTTSAQKLDAVPQAGNSVPSPVLVVNSEPVTTSSESQSSDSHHSPSRSVNYVEQYVEEDSEDAVECECVCPQDDEGSEDDSETEPDEPPLLSLE